MADAITGLPECLASLKAISRDAQKKVVPKMVRAGIGAARKIIKPDVPVRGSGGLASMFGMASNITTVGTLARAMGSRQKTYSSGTTVGLYGARKNQRTQIGQRVRGRRLGAFARFLAENTKGRQAAYVGQPIIEDPAKIAHLAGPGREQQFMGDASTVDAAMLTAAQAAAVKGIAEAAKW